MSHEVPHPIATAIAAIVDDDMRRRALRSWNRKQRRKHGRIRSGSDNETRKIRSKSRRWLRWWQRHYGDWCPGAVEMGHPAHQADDDLSIDHIVPLLYLRLVGMEALAYSGHPRNLRVLCRDANTDKGGQVLGRPELERARQTCVLNYVCPFDRWRGKFVWDWLKGERLWDSKRKHPPSTRSERG